MQYLKIENPPRFPEEFRPNSSFSLFLTAKLVHGVIVIHHKQVTNTLGKLNFSYCFQQLWHEFFIFFLISSCLAGCGKKTANISCDM